MQPLRQRNYVAPSTGREIKAVLCDTFGTVVDWRSGITGEVRAFAQSHTLIIDAELFADQWRGEYQASMDPIREGAREYVPLDQLHLENLQRTLPLHGLSFEDFKEADVQALNRGWERLPPWPDSLPGLAALRRHYIVGPLSNANTSLLVNMAKNAGLPWDVIIGSDITRTYKPDPVAYEAAAAILGLHPGEVMLCAAHNGDLTAARHTGMATAFIPRPTEHGPEQSSDLAASSSWDIVASDLVELASKLDYE
ncbi:MAG: haloacid dehalogenase type II [Pseudarthrobacter sp.]